MARTVPFSTSSGSQTCVGVGRIERADFSLDALAPERTAAPAVAEFAVDRREIIVGIETFGPAGLATAAGRPHLRRARNDPAPIQTVAAHR